MDTAFDRRTERDRERSLMARVRSGAISEDALAAEMLSFPVKLQIQTVSPCNAACIMCPWPQTKGEMPQGTMAEDVFREVVSQMRGRGVERTGLYLMNEPTLDARLARRTAYLKEQEPGTCAQIFTNGVRLTGDRALALADAGMDEITISVVGFDRESHGRIMLGVDFDVIMANIDAIARLVAAGRMGSTQVAIVGLEFPGQAELVGSFRERTGLPVFTKHVTNIAGLVELDRIGVTNEMAREPVACQRPFVKGYVLYNGDLVLCNCDWMRTTIIGNVMKEPIDVLWKNEILMAIRRQHLRRKFDPGSICAKCDYPYLP